jgi:hypothetical protein
MIEIRDRYFVSPASYDMSCNYYRDYRESNFNIKFHLTIIIIKFLIIMHKCHMVMMLYNKRYGSLTIIGPFKNR